jgi:hypothetical protein
MATFSDIMRSIEDLGILKHSASALLAAAFVGQDGILRRVGNPPVPERSLPSRPTSASGHHFPKNG